MEIKFKYIFNIDFIITFFFLIASIIFLIWLIEKVKDVMKKFKSFVNYISIALMLILIYQLFKSFRQEIAYYPKFDADFLLTILTYFTIIDIIIWLIFKFMQAYAKNNIYKNSDIDNPDKIKENIESIINEQNFTQNLEMEKLYNTLQISALSIKKQEKILRSNFKKNILISILFFILGLIIPKVLMLIISNT